MKKFIIFLSFFLPLGFLSCETRPIKPEIIGTTTLQEEKGIIYAEIDSVRYVPTIIFTGKKVGKDSTDEQIPPTVGLQVTCFTSKELPDTTFFKGTLTEEQIEKYYYKNVTGIAMFVILFITFCVLIGIIKKE